MVQAGAAHQYLEPIFFILPEILEHLRAVDRQFHAVVNEYQPPQLITHFYRTQEIDHQLKAQLIISEAYAVGSAHGHDLLYVGLLLNG
ncbi:MAG: hypothetical protein ABII68_06530 [Pseudomonadota bacterium]